MKSRTVSFPAAAPFQLRVCFENPEPSPPDFAFHHIHEECEIYINLSGSVAFMVEDRLYPILPGSVIITRPYEYHHCIRYSEENHRHFCLQFSCRGNEEFFDLFFRRPPGQGNLLMLDEQKTDTMFALCRDMIERPGDAVLEYYRFFRLIELLRDAHTPEIPDNLHPDVSLALHHILGHYAEPISVRELARAANVSVSTLERHFADNLHMMPYAYLQRRRLAKALELLTSGATLTDCCEKCGFADCSAFIAQFRREYGVTPLQYQKGKRRSTKL